MSRSRLTLSIFCALLAATLIAPAAWAAPHEAQSHQASTEVAMRLWHALTTMWLEAGCYIDPHGGCTLSLAHSAAGDVGCWIDPHGTCKTNSGVPAKAGPSIDAGCIADPHGGCLPGS